MKKIFLTFASIALLACQAGAQAPKQFNYQGVARSANGSPMANQSVSIRISILDGSATGTARYVEKQSVTTNAYGLYNLAIGSGTAITGTMAAVDWGDDDKYIKVEIDPAGGSAYTLLGTTQLLSVPYAMYAAEGNPGPVGPQGPAGPTGPAGATGPAGSLTGAAGGDLSGTYPNPTIGSSKVTAAKIASNAITTAKINNAAVTADKLASNAVTAAKIASNAITTAKIANGAVTAAKLNAMSATNGQVLKWNGTAWAPATDNTGTAGWELSGNTATLANFIGTTNNIPLVFKVNNEKAGSVTISTHNTALGYQSLNANYQANNTAIGYQSLAANTQGYENTAVGNIALKANTIGNFNTALGNAALQLNTTGHDNTAVGNYALPNNVTGNYNVAVGYHAAEGNSGSYNTNIGAISGAYSNNYSYNIVIGYNALPTSSHQVRIGALSGTPAPTSIGGAVAWSNLSDGRFKTNIQENVPGLAFISRLRPVTYTIDDAKLSTYIYGDKKPDEKDEPRQADAPEQPTVVRTGFIAQEVEAAANKAGFDFDGVDKPQNDKDLYGLRYAEFVVPLVKAVQEQQAVIEAQNEKIEKLTLLVQQLMNRND